MNEKGKQASISIIVVSYKDTLYLTKCLNSIIANTEYPDYEIIVVYYGETKKFFYPSNKVKVNNIDHNPGYSEANNIGVRQSKGEFLCLLNNDTIVSKGWLTSLNNLLMTTDKIGCVQSKLKLIDYPDRFDSVGHITDPLGFLRVEGYMEQDKGQYDKIREICVVQPAACLIRRTVINEVGLFDSDYFWGHEDTDLSVRIHLSGYKILLDPNSVVYHKRSPAISKMPEEFIVYYSRRNSVLTILKNYELRNSLFAAGFLLLPNIAISAWYVLSGKSNCALAILKAFSWNLVNYKQTCRKRFEIQKRRKVSDRELFKKMDKINLANLFRKRRYGTLALVHSKKSNKP